MDRPRPNVAEFYEQTVLPALTARLDEAFPEFAWRRDPRGWRATNDEFTHERLGVRAERVVCHGEAPRGLLIHGDGPVLWTTFVNDGAPARGRDFVAAVRRLADRAGVDASELDRPPGPQQGQQVVLEDAFDVARRELLSPRGEVGRRYLVDHRGLSADALGGVGMMPPRDVLVAALASRGHSRRDIEAVGLVADSRWPGRIIGAWRDADHSIGTLWARTTKSDAPAESRYLYLRGRTRADLPPYGLGEALDAGFTSVILVEGVLDVHQLRAHGITNGAALGGTSVAPSAFEHLERLGVTSVTLCFDNDPAGLSATTRAVDASTRASQSPDVLVIDPAKLRDVKDAGDVLRRDGIDGWNRLTPEATCGIEWRAVGLYETACATEGRRAGLAAAGRWLGRLPERLAIEQDVALQTVSGRDGKDADAVRRAFRARYWQPDRSPYPPMQAHATR